MAFQKYVNSSQAYEDNTLNVYYPDYVSTDEATFAELDSLTTSDFLTIGFNKQLTGINIKLIGGHENSTANTTLTVYYWDGNQWVSVGSLTDGTEANSVSFAASGTVTWDYVSRPEEVRKTISNSIPLYYYKFIFDEAMDADTQLYYISGIPKQETIEDYYYPFMAQKRLFLCGNAESDKNKVVCTSQDTSQVFNGSDSFTLYIGNEEAVNAECSVYAQYGSFLYDLIMLFKDNETWLVSGVAPDWTVYKLSSEIGCPAPATLRTVHVPVGVVPEMDRNIAIWQGTNGIYVSDGRSPVPIHSDIENFFDKRSSSCIKASMLGSSVGFIDKENLEYHWLFASGTSTTLNEEWVFDIKRWRWYEIERGSGKALQCGFGVQDTYGNTYTYGGIDTGYLERLGYGTTFDGTGIAQTFRTGDFPMTDILDETAVRYINLVTVAKESTSNSITATHYVNTQTTGTDYTMSPLSSGYRVANNV